MIRFRFAHGRLPAGPLLVFMAVASVAILSMVAWIRHAAVPPRAEDWFIPDARVTDRRQSLQYPTRDGQSYALPEDPRSDRTRKAATVREIWLTTDANYRTVWRYYANRIGIRDYDLDRVTSLEQSGDIFYGTLDQGARCRLQPRFLSTDFGRNTESYQVSVYIGTRNPDAETTVKLTVVAKP